MTVIAGLFALLFAAVHVLIGKLRFLDGIPRSRWLSLAGGVAVTYVFLHIIPELSEHQRRLAGGEESEAAEGSHAYLLALLGLAVFYGLERAVRTSQGRSGAETGESTTGVGAFWLHIGSFAVYNLLIGYLLLRRPETGLVPLLFYAAAMGLHFLSNDYGLRLDHPHRYDQVARWLLAAAVLLGWALGVVSELDEAVVSALFAFLAGGVVLNVLKEELPEERESRFGAFALGAGAYAGLLLLAG